MASEGRSTNALIAIVAAIITAIVGPIVVFKVTHSEEPASHSSVAPDISPQIPAATPRTSTFSAAPNEAERWVASANSYCRSLDSALKAAGQINTYQDVPIVAPKLASLYRKMDSHLRSTAPPPALSGQVISMTQYWDRAADFLTQAVQYYQQGNQLGVQAALNSSQASNQTGNQIAYSLGLSVCADAGTL